MSIFRKRHYEAVATAMQRAYREGINRPRHQWLEAVNELADTFAADNGAFKRDRFIQACQPGANVKARK